MTIQEVGAALSAALGAARARAGGYGIGFLILGAFAPRSLALGVALRSIVKPAIENPDEAVAARASAA